MSDRFKKLLEAKARHQKLAAWRKPDRFTLFLGKGLVVSCGILTLGFFFIVFTRALGLGEVFGDSVLKAIGVIMGISFVALLLIAATLAVVLPSRKFLEFRDDEYKLGLKQLFLITAILAVLCAAVGYVVRQASTMSQDEYDSSY